MSLSPQEESELLGLLSHESNVESLDTYINRVTPRYPPPPHVRRIMEAVERSRREPIRLTISMPPRHAKTETGMNGLAWRLLYDPACTNAFCGYQARFAQRKSRVIQKRYISSGGFLDPKATAVDFWKTLHGGGLMAGGVDGPLTGEGITGLGYIDDPIKNRKEADSATIRDNVWEWYTSTFHTRIEPGASIVVVATRWHDDDLIGRLHSPDYEHEDFENINLPAVLDLEGNVADERVLDEDGNVMRGVFRDDVRALWPGYWPLIELEKKRLGAGEYDWWSLYQGFPQPKGAKVFRNDPSRYSLEEFKKNELSKGGFRFIIAVDPAATASTRADYSVAAVGCAKGYNEDMQVWWLDVMRGQWTIPRLCRQLKALQEQWRVPLAIEAVGAFKAVPDNLAETDPTLVLLPVKLLGDKFARSQPYASAWNDNRVHTPYDAPWANDWLAEHASFTGVNDKFDDQIDAAAHGYTALLRASPVREIPGNPYTGPWG